MPVIARKATLWRKEVDNRPGMLASTLQPGSFLQFVRDRLEVLTQKENAEHLDERWEYQAQLRVQQAEVLHLDELGDRGDLDGEHQAGK